LKPPFHRDDLSAAQRQLFTAAAAATVAEAIELFRPEYAAWVRGIAPTDPDDDALAMRWLAGMSEADRGTLTHLPSAELAAMAREALAQLDGYLRDAAVTFRRWEFDPSDIACPVWLWYGADDPNVSIRNGRWLAHAIPRATLEVLPTTTHLQALVGNWGHAFAALRVTT
jgi:pimeloyl-ACP methyl ester carboxylesterase